MKHEKQIEEMGGIVSPLFTPFDENGELNIAMLSRIARFQLEAGVSGFFLTGSTGEGLLMSEAERLEVFRQIANEFSSDAVVIAHVGHPSTDAACRLAKGAAGCGCHWVASVAPIYHGTTFEGATRHYGQIAASTELPFMIYSLGGVIEPNRDAAWFDLPNVSGIKYTGSDYYSVEQLMRFVDRPIAVMNGFDQQLVAGLAMGFDGGIGTTYNFAPHVYCDLYDSFKRGDVERAFQLQRDINRVTELMCRFENWSYRKAIMRYIGFDCGPARAPYAPLTEQQYATYEKQLDELAVLKRYSFENA